MFLCVCTHGITTCICGPTGSSPCCTFETAVSVRMAIQMHEQAVTTSYFLPVFDTIAVASVLFRVLFVLIHLYGHILIWNDVMP